MSLLRFFSAPVGTPGSAVLNWAAAPTADIFAYARGYRDAGNRLLHAEEDREFGELDHGACPILFLFRHSLELSLRAMICRAALISVSESELAYVLPRLWREHSLCRLLAMAEPMMEALGRTLPALRMKHEDVLGVVEELDRIDSGSYVFRYPVTVKGSASLPSSVHATRRPGLLRPRKAAQFVCEHDLSFTGDYPHNTSGGQLGCGQAGAASGIVGMVEVLRQITQGAMEG